MKCPKCQAEVSDDSRFCSHCGASLHPSDDVLISHTKTIFRPMQELSSGTILAGKYKIVEVIGKGGMGIVYKAEDIKLKRLVALKFLPPELVQDEEAKVRFELEAQAAAALSHPYICTIHEIEEAEGKPFIAMEYVEGEILKSKINQGPIKTDEALELAIQMAQGLEEAHRKGIVHRDIKSANVMVTDKGQAKIMDFGLAKVKERTLFTREGTTLGTVAYMSPEQARGEKVDSRTDIWSLGVVLYEMVSGKLPFKGDREASILYSVVHEEPQPLKAVKRDIPSGIQQIVSRTMRKKKESRYQSVTEMLNELKRFQQSRRSAEAGVFNIRAFLRIIRKPMMAIPGLVVIAALIVAAVWFFNRQAKIRWARDKAIPEIIELVEEEQYIPAFQLAQQVEKHIPNDPLLTGLWPKMSIKVSIRTDPSSADIYRKNYEDVDSSWEYLGKSPIDSIRIPIGYFRWKIEKKGYETIERAFPFSNLIERIILDKKSTIPISNLIERIILDKKSTIPINMVRVPNVDYAISLIGAGNLEAIELGDYLIDKYEVTNRQFKGFVDSGGYQKQEYWEHEFKQNGKIISWKEAIFKFKDSTGRPGPSTWEVGTYPEGQDDYPVCGVSWYEAEAFARYAEKELPTIYHWAKAAGLNSATYIVPLSNFNNKGSAPVGQYRGISHYGTFDMAGNVKEWCFNAVGSDRYILGGAWDEPGYICLHTDTKSPFDRSRSNGFRCIKYLTKSKSPQKTRDAVRVDTGIVDYSKLEPVSEEIFRAFTHLFSYDKTKLNSVIEFRDESSSYWIKEKISFDAAYGNERIFGYLFIPKNSAPPYQTVILFPGALAFNLRSSSEGNNLHSWDAVDFIIKSGRAVLYPIYKSYYERGDGFSIYDPNMTINSLRNHIVMWRKDLGRSIDYLESRSDIGHDKICFYGSSWGSIVGIYLLAIEKRLKTGIFRAVGFIDDPRQYPEIGGINYAARIRIPVLILNGKYDTICPYKTSQLPLFRFLGTPKEHKRMVLFDLGHAALRPRSKAIKEVLDWLDRYLGPVK